MRGQRTEEKEGLILVVLECCLFRGSCDFPLLHGAEAITASHRAGPELRRAHGAVLRSSTEFPPDSAGTLAVWPVFYMIFSVVRLLLSIFRHWPVILLIRLVYYLICRVVESSII